MIYDVNGDLLWNFVVAIPFDDLRAFECKVKCTAGYVLAAIPSANFDNITVEARPVESPAASWTNIVTDPLDLTDNASVVPQPYEIRISTESTAAGRNMFSLYVGLPLE